MLNVSPQVVRVWRIGHPDLEPAQTPWAGKEYRVKRRTPLIIALAAGTAAASARWSRWPDRRPPSRSRRRPPRPTPRRAPRPWSPRVPRSCTRAADDAFVGTPAVAFGGLHYIPYDADLQGPARRSAATSSWSPTRPAQAKYTSVAQDRAIGDAGDHPEDHLGGRRQDRQGAAQDGRPASRAPSWSCSPPRASRPTLAWETHRRRHRRRGRQPAHRRRRRAHRQGAQAPRSTSPT